MSTVENLIYQFDGTQREIMLFFHNLFTVEYGLTDKVTFNNPCYYQRSWICYLKPTKNGNIELAFLRGDELSNIQGLLESHGRKQVSSIEFSDVAEIPLETIEEIIQEAILLDETTPYASKRGKG